MVQATKKIWMDGSFVVWDNAQVHVLTHTLHYGMGVFEGIRCYETAHGSAIFRLQEHLDRLLAAEERQNAPHHFHEDLPGQRSQPEVD